MVQGLVTGLYQRLHCMCTNFETQCVFDSIIMSNPNLIIQSNSVWKKRTERELSFADAWANPHELAASDFIDRDSTVQTSRNSSPK